MYGFVSGQFDYFGCEIGASNELQWQKIRFCILHKGDDRHLHEGKPVNALLGYDAWHLNDRHIIMFFWRMTYDIEWWQENWGDHSQVVISMTTIIAWEQTVMLHAVNFDVSVQGSVLFLNSIIICYYFMMFDIFGSWNDMLWIFLNEYMINCWWIVSLH